MFNVYVLYIYVNNHTNYAMENETSDKATAVTRPRLYGIIQTYMQKKLPRDVHPAFKALRNREEAAITSLQLPSTSGTTSPLHAMQEQTSGNEQIGESFDDGNLPL